MVNEHQLPLGRAMARREAKAGLPIRRPSHGRAEHILAEAAQLFRDQGYAGTSMSDISEAVGILPGSLYHYVDSKDDLLFRVIERAHLVLEERLDKLDPDGLTAHEALRLMVRAHIEGIVEHLPYGVVSNIDLRELDENRQDRILTLRSAYQNRFTSMIKRGQAAQQFCGRLDPILTSIAITVIANSPLTWYTPGRSRWSPEDLLEHNTSMAMRTVTCDHHPACTTI